MSFCVLSIVWSCLYQVGKLNRTGEFLNRFYTNLIVILRTVTSFLEDSLSKTSENCFSTWPTPRSYFEPISNWLFFFQKPIPHRCEIDLTTSSYCSFTVQFIFHQNEEKTQKSQRNSVERRRSSLCPGEVNLSQIS